VAASFLISEAIMKIQPQLLNTREAALYLGTTPNTLKCARKDSVLWGRKPPTYIKAGTLVRYRKETLDKWLADLPEEQLNTAQ